MSAKVKEGKLFLIDIESEEDQFIQIDGDLVRIFTQITEGRSVESVMNDFPEDQRPEIQNFIQDMLQAGIIVKRV